MQRKLFILAAIAGLFQLMILSAASQPKGATDMVLYGGKSGDVQFPHYQHQVSAGDCNRCHNLFAQAKGAIRAGQDQGRLKPKQVMNQCRDCHKDMKTSGEKAGPTNCKGCHKP